MNPFDPSQNTIDYIKQKHMKTRKETALKSIEEAEQRIKDAQRQIELAKKDIEAIDSKPKRFKARKGQEYYFINGLRDAAATTWDGYLVDKKNYILGNVFKTKEQAEANKEKYLKKIEILEWMEGNRIRFSHGVNNYSIRWNWHYNTPIIDSDSNHQSTKYCFEKGKAKECIDKFGQDLKLIFE